MIISCTSDENQFEKYCLTSGPLGNQTNSTGGPQSTDYSDPEDLEEKNKSAATRLQPISKKVLILYFGMESGMNNTQQPETTYQLKAWPTNTIYKGNLFSTSDKVVN